MTATHVIATKRKRCPFCRHMVELKSAAVVVTPPAKGPIGRVARPRAALFHLVCWQRARARGLSA